MEDSKIVIAGGGMVAGYAAKQMVELGLKSGDLAILSADNSVPYERPPLSKGFLAGSDTEEGIRINQEDFYREHGIDVRLGTGISGVDTAGQMPQAGVRCGVRVRQADYCNGCEGEYSQGSRRDTRKRSLPAIAG